MMRLDIGCGTNKKEGFMGVDVRVNPAVDFVMSATALKFPNNSISEVYSRRCIQHVPDDMQALREIYRILVLGGRFELILASWIGWLYYHVRWFGRPKGYPCFHFYTRRKLSRMMKHIGFQICEISTVKNDIKVVCTK